MEAGFVSDAWEGEPLSLERNLDNRLHTGGDENEHDHKHAHEHTLEHAIAG